MVRLCHPHWENLSRLTFQPQHLEPSWLVWREEIFLPILFPRLQAMRLACTSGHRDQLLAGDVALDESLPAEMADRSRRAGQLLMNAFPAPPAEKLWRHYGGLVASGGTSGHLCAVLAVRAAAFHVAPSLLAAAYVFLEARGGLGETGVAQWMEMTDDCLRASAKHEGPGLRAA